MHFFKNLLRPLELKLEPSWKSCALFPPGHFYSPLLDLASIGPEDPGLAYDGHEWWECVELRRDAQRAYFLDLLNHFQPLPFLLEENSHARYSEKNGFFPFSDAFTLSGIMRKETPRRIVEVGCGVSSAAMLDTRDEAGLEVRMTFIEPYPNRLYSMITSKDREAARIIAQPVQEVALSVFEELEAQDILFIDSSHVAKIGSDLSFLILRVMPRLKPGVLVHFHDVFYPYSYPAEWIREGRAWNESLFLRAFLIGNQRFEIVAFNSFAAHFFPEIFKEKLPAFLANPGASIWLRKTA